jgi:hypothetical protein
MTIQQDIYTEEDVTRLAENIIYILTVSKKPIRVVWGHMDVMPQGV